MENVKSKLKTSWPYIFSLIVFIVVIPTYAFKDNINFFGKIAIFCAMTGMALNIISLISRVCDSKGVSKTLLKFINLTVFAVFTYFTVIILI